MNVLDLAIVLLVTLSAVNGYRRGAALQLTAYAGLLLGLVAGALLAPVFAGLVKSRLAPLFSELSAPFPVTPAHAVDINPTRAAVPTTDRKIIRAP